MLKIVFRHIFCLFLMQFRLRRAVAFVSSPINLLKKAWICIAHRREHASNALPLPVRRRLYPRHTGGAVPLRFLVKITTTVSVVFHSFPDVFFFAVLPRNQGGITAESRRCQCGHGDPIELLLRFDGGATAIIGGGTAGPVRCHCGATGVALRLQGGSMTSARRLDNGGGFRSNSLQFSLLLRTLLLLLPQTYK